MSKSSVLIIGIYEKAIFKAAQPGKARVPKVIQKVETELRTSCGCQLVKTLVFVPGEGIEPFSESLKCNNWSVIVFGFGLRGYAPTRLFSGFVLTLRVQQSGKHPSL